MKKRNARSIAVVLVALILATILPAALASGGFPAVVTSSIMKVYQQKSPYKVLGTLAKGTMVTVEAYSGQAALIRYNGRTGLVRISDLSATASAVSAPAEAPAAAATAAEQASARKMVTNRATRIYKRASKSAGYVTVKAGTEVGLVAVNGNVAKVVKGGAIGYTMASHLSEPDAAKSGAETASQAKVEQYNRVAVATTAKARVYAKPSTSSSYVTVGKGTAMVLLATKGNCAMVERGGRVGYVAKSLLTTDVDAAKASNPSSEVKTGEVKADDSALFSGSNEEVIFRFLTRVAGYNTAAACGILANIKYESGYKATSRNSSGSSYGIAQWTGTRKTRLINWCKDNGYDYTSLKGQLYFLQYELKRYYPSVHNKLMSVSNTEQGAYDAGYDFCYRYEAPSSRASRSVTRGSYARTTLWKRYST